MHLVAAVRMQPAWSSLGVQKQAAWRLDHLGRSLKNLIETITARNEGGIGFRSVHEQIDTTTPSGKLIFHIFGALS